MDEEARLERAGIPVSEALRALHWMVAEYCVSLFAQSLGTRRPVSPQRLARQWEQARAAG